MKSQPLVRRAAFTLIEILTVIAIIAMLAALGFAGLRFAQNKAREKKTANLLANITKALEEYRLDRGAYPRPAEDQAQTQVDGETYNIGGAKTLYQFLSGDGTNAIKGGGDKMPTGQQASAEDPKDPTLGKIYMDTVVAPTEQQIKDKKHTELVESAGEGNYYLIDPWRHPFQYQVQDFDKNGIASNVVKMNSGDKFEIWSYGPLKKPEASEDAKKQWIATWNTK